ncbi:MAG: pyridoxal kinase PdxY [Alphaproteobacteria bacterium]|nr:pyridoxal kinase PdxY [Alphaproteobacteria bacterium]OJV47044.1 MAG: pyridoxal kinase [Alphaproteobacteria bacterium 43-37]
MTILSIQSHVSYGYVGNRAATFPLQSLGYDVWSVNTVNFSNHTGYGKWKGQILGPEAVRDVIQGILDLEAEDSCQAILSGYLGSAAIGNVIIETVNRFKTIKPDLIYMCDPVMGDVGRGFFVKDEVVDFFKKIGTHAASIITPNHFEAEILYGAKIKTLDDALKACQFFHDLGIKVATITSLILDHTSAATLHVLVSTPEQQLLGQTPYLPFTVAPNGTGDLFSALFLGHYLKTHDISLALKQTLSSIFSVINRTFLSGNRELCLIAEDYKNPPLFDEITVLQI